MDDVAVKLIASPLLIWAASLVGRRWGQSISGWLVGLPLTSGPVAFFLALDYGKGFAAKAALGSLAGTAAQAGFCLAYGLLARRCDWLVALLAATIAFLLGAVLFEIVAPPLFVLLAIVVIALAGTLRILPRAEMESRKRASPPRWDIPARMVVTGGLVVGLGAAAPIIGPHLAGFLSTYPVFATVLTVFAHRLDGEAAARRVLRGLLIGLFGFTAFFTVLALALEAIGIAAAFATAAGAAVAVQACSLWVLRHRRRNPSRTVASPGGAR